MVEQRKFNNTVTTKKFKSEKNKGYVLLLWFPSFIFLFVLLIVPRTEIPILVAILVGVLALLLLHILGFTYYTISAEDLGYRFGFFRGQIPIRSIKKIVRDDALLKMSIRKPALSNKGITIFYDKNDVYISPINRNEFIQVLLDLNPAIIVVGFDNENT